MTKTFLTQKFAPEDMDKRRTLGLKLNRISDENAVGLLNDLRSMNADQLWSFVSKMDEAIHVPVLNCLAVESLPEVTGLRYDTTLRMISLLVKGAYDATEDQKPEIIAGVIKLIDGYQHRTKLNLMTGLFDALGDEGVALVKGNVAFDQACSNHLQRVLQKPYKSMALTDMTKSIGMLRLPKALSILAEDIRVRGDNLSMSILVSDLYCQDALLPTIIEPIRAALGDQILIDRAQIAIQDNEGKSSLARIISMQETQINTSLSGIIEVFGEDKVITDDILRQAMVSANGDIKKSRLLSIFTHDMADAPFAKWPKTRDFVYEHLKDLTVSTDSILQHTFIKHCAADGHAQPVMDVIIGKLKVYMMNADKQHERSDYGVFDYEGCTQAQILNRTFDAFYKANWRDAQLKTWRWCAIDLIQETGILEFAELAEGANARLMSELIDAIGEPENKTEILQKLVRFRGAWFTQELGV
ncbi:hypothetical protein [Pseudomonas sp. PLMAX]|uniref:hypothetical protein n=1 Tax=Pseudomonas sp. PLMAX TaxID=2201998 RepID=UPI0038B70B84